MDSLDINLFRCTLGLSPLASDTLQVRIHGHKLISQLVWSKLISVQDLVSKIVLAIENRWRRSLGIKDQKFYIPLC